MKLIHSKGTFFMLRQVIGNWIGCPVLLPIGLAVGLTASVAVGAQAGGGMKANERPSASQQTSLADDGVAMTVDPLTRYAHIRYHVPTEAGDECVVQCAWSPKGAGEWRLAKVQPLLSETALLLATDSDWQSWMLEGRIVERRASGLERTVVFNPYPDGVAAGGAEVDFRIQISTPGGQLLVTRQGCVELHQPEVVYIEDWSQVFQKSILTTQPAGDGLGWTFANGSSAPAGATLGNVLIGISGRDTPLRPLTYPLDLRGWYAIFVCTRSGGSAGESIQLRLTGDELWGTLASGHASEEVFWRWARMDRQHLVLRQPWSYKGCEPAQIDYVKLVPLSAEHVDQLEADFGTPDKLIAGYWEPYSWAFGENIRETLQHRQPISAYAKARVQILDTQIGRFGMKSVYETRLTDQLIYGTIGDPVPGDRRPQTDNVGRMQQYTNTLDATVRYASGFGLQAFANFGASNCYVGTPLQGDFSKQHPQWMRSARLRFEVPEVRAYALSLIREALEIGAPGISIDFCRYPQTIDRPETCNLFLKDLRALTDEFGGKNGSRVSILVRFPGKGVERWEMFDYPTWAREGWVDYLCPSNIQGRHMHIDVTPYIEAVRGTRCTLLPNVEGLSWGLPMPGPFLWRVDRLYQAGIVGLYTYQAGDCVSGRPENSRCLRRLASREGVENFWENDRRQRPLCSKGIYLSRPMARDGCYHPYQRIRVWLEGIDMNEVEFLLDGKLVNRCEGPPYLLGTEDRDSDNILPQGEHHLKVRARDGEGWIEQTFTVTGVG